MPLLFAVIDIEDERRLITRLKQRDTQAMAELYQRFGRLAYSLIYRIVHDTGATEDLVQETFLRVWNRVQAFDEERGALGPWLLAVARNRAIDYLRSIDGRMARNALELDANEHPSQFTDMERDLLNSERSRLLKAAFEKLTSNQRTVIELAYFEGLSQSEMAERLQQPLGTVKTWVRAALRVLRDSLEKVVTA